MKSYISHLLLPFLLLTLLATGGHAVESPFILCFGDSTTAFRPGKVDQVYSVRLAQQLRAQGIPVRVGNEGIPGSHSGSVTDNARFKIAHARDRIDERILAQAPDWVVMQFGINDSYADTGGADGASRIPLPAYRENLLFLVRKMKAAGIEVLLMTPNPFGSSLEPHRHERLLRYVETLREVAHEESVPLVDIFAHFQEAAQSAGKPVDAWLLDGVHPSDKGHALVADALTAFFREQLAAPVAKAPPQKLAPRLDGPWIQVAHSPELPEIDSKAGQVVDHCFFQDINRCWQLWTQIRGTAVGRLFYRWEGGQDFAHPDWAPKGICWRADRAAGESWQTGKEEFIHAPYVLRYEKEWVLYYGGGASENGDPQISIARSSDGRTFSRLKDAHGRTAAFTGPGYARDAMVLQIDDQWVNYYAADKDGHGLIAARTAAKPYGAPWSPWRSVSAGGLCGNDRTSQQCPYVVFLEGYYYLFKMGPSNRYETAVYRSRDPFDFGQEDEKLVTVLEASAAEVIVADGRYYLSSLIPGYQGVRICPLAWEALE